MRNKDQAMSSYDDVVKLLKEGVPPVTIAKRLGKHRSTVYGFRRHAIAVGDIEGNVPTRNMFDRNYSLGSTKARMLSDLTDAELAFIMKKVPRRGDITDVILELVREAAR